MIKPIVDNKTNNSENDKKDLELENEKSCHKYNLFQQFFVIGFEPKILHLIEKKNLKSLPEQLIGPKIISKYPNNDFPYINIPDSLIASHCFPNGFKNLIIEVNENNLKEKLNQTYDFIFSLDNFQYEKDISLKMKKIYYTCHFFYESSNDYINCLELLKNKKNIALNKNYLIPKVICISSFCPYFQQSKLILSYLKQYINKFKYSSINSNNSFLNNQIYLPIEKIIEGFIYNIPALPRANFTMRITKENFCVNEESMQQSNIKEKELIFENSPLNRKPKPMINYALLMKFFKIEEIFEIIKLIILEEPILFFSNNLEFLTYTIEGIVSLIYPFEYHYPVIAILPEINYSFINIYKSFIFGINDTYSENIFSKKGIDLDEQKNINIVIIENRFNNLLNNNEKEKNKISVIINIKPNNSKFLKITEKSINTSIFKIKESFIRKKSMIGANFEEEVEDKNENDKKIKLPSHYFSKCCKKFENNLENKFKELKVKFKDQEKDKILYQKLVEAEKGKIVNEEITEIFLYFFTSIFLHYQEYCTKCQFSYNNSNTNPNVRGSLIKGRVDTIRNGYYFRDQELEKKYYMNKLQINDLFNCDLFIDEMPSLDRPFYSKFFKTKIFFNFMKKKLFPISLQDKLDILFFDDNVNAKLSREAGMKKIETKFLEYDISNMTSDIKIDSLTKPFTDNFKIYLSQEKNKAKIMNYFQYIIPKNNENNEIKEVDNYNSNYNDFKISFYYFVFPKLLNDCNFYNKYKDEEDESNIERNISNFTCVNSNCLYNQFEKEGNNIVNNENIIKNYHNYYYTFNPHKSYKNLFEYYVKNLYLQFLSKVFHQIPYSKKEYYFNYLMFFMINNKDLLNENSIMMMFLAIVKYGNSKMAKEFFIFVKNKSYTTFLILREKTRPDKNWEEEIKNISEKTIDNYDDYFNENVKIYNQKGRSKSEFNISNIRLSTMANFKQRKFSSIEGEEKAEPDLVSNDNTSKKETEYIINDNFSFTLNLFCTQKNSQNEVCNFPFDITMNSIFSENKKHMEYKCLKCEKNQELTISCRYSDEGDEAYVINTKLYSPLTLLENDWFKKSSELNLSYITENHLEEYICAIFYFYDQSLLCEFFLPEIILKKPLEVEHGSTFSLTLEKIVQEQKNNIMVNNNNFDIEIDNDKINLTNTTGPRNSFFDISDQKQNFFEFKSTKKKSSLIGNNAIKKKVNPSKKSVGFAIKTKKVGSQKKNSLSYSAFLNNNN